MSGKKRILFLEYFPLMAGGQAVLLSILENLKNLYAVEVLLFNHGPIEEKLKSMNIKTHFIQAPPKVKFRYFIKTIDFMKKVFSFLKAGEYSLIYSSGYFATKLIALPAFMLKIPVIWHKHQIINRHYFSYLSSQVRFYSKFVSKIICVSDASKKSLVKAGVEINKLITVHNGMKIPDMNRVRYGALTRKKYGLKTAFIAGTLGYFRRNKGLDLLIAAAEKVKGQNSNIKFLIAGKAEPADLKYEQELRLSVKEKGMEKTVIFAGFQKKFDFLPALDIFVLPSDNEPFALSVLESLGSGVPVMAFDSGGTPEVVKDGFNGYIVKEMNPDELSKAILSAYENRAKLKKMGRNAALNIKKEFTVEKQMKKIRSVIDASIS
jgi:glycosyltransferase involved in cell wall biosynthesis